MRKIVLTAAMLAIASPVLAQSGSDPDKNVSEGGVKVAGWMGRTDKPSQNINNAKFVSMGPGFHVTAGPPAIYWNPANVGKVGAKGYTVKASLTQTKAPTHPEAFGVFAAGTDLGGPKVNYLYLIVRGDGKFMVKHYIGAETHTLKEWTDNAAVKKQDEAGKATNEVAINVAPDKTTFWVNGTEVFSLASKDIVGEQKLVSLDGIGGLRVNHNLDVHVGSFSVTPNK